MFRDQRTCYRSDGHCLQMDTSPMAIPAGRLEKLTSCFSSLHRHAKDLAWTRQFEKEQSS